METTTNTTKTTTQTKKTYAHASGVYAVVTMEGEEKTQVVYAKTRIELNKTLGGYGKEMQIHGVFKGRQLQIKQKVSFNFN